MTPTSAPGVRDGLFRTSVLPVGILSYREDWLRAERELENPPSAARIFPRCDGAVSPDASDM
jgi:hypothetical protein